MRNCWNPKKKKKKKKKKAAIKRTLEREFWSNIHERSLKFIKSREPAICIKFPPYFTIVPAIMLQFQFFPISKKFATWPFSNRESISLIYHYIDNTAQLQISILPSNNLPPRIRSFFENLKMRANIVSSLDRSRRMFE